MAEETKGQEPEQKQEPEQEPEQEQEPVQGEDTAQEPEEEQQKDEPEKEKGEGLLMPILYALLAAVGAFTLVLIIGIVVSILTRPPEDPSEFPSAEQSSQVTLAPSSTEAETQTPAGEGSNTDAES